MNREQTLNAALQYVMKDRNANYQDPEDNFADIAYLWSWQLKEKLTQPITTWEVALMSAMIKFARIKGNPYHEDNWVDIAGYAACGAECAEKEQQKFMGLDELTHEINKFIDNLSNPERWKQLEWDIFDDNEMDSDFH